jgi:hypothetical protein
MDFVTNLFCVVLFAATAAAQAGVATKSVEIAVIVAYQKNLMFHRGLVSPAIEIAVAKVHNNTNLLPDYILNLRFADSMCSISDAINEAFNLYLRRTVHVYMGPICDYACAPVARQLKYWNLPMVTPGAVAGDFRDYKRRLYPMLTRVGITLNSLAIFMNEVLGTFKWNRVKLFYDKTAQGDRLENLCHFVALALHKGFQTVDGLYHDFHKILPNKDITDDMMISEIGNKFSGRSFFF